MGIVCRWHCICKYNFTGLKLHPQLNAILDEIKKRRKSKEEIRPMETDRVHLAYLKRTL
jgi:hypothetical protein